MYEKFLTTDYPNIFFEDNKVGQLKKRLWDASEEEIQKILDDYVIPSDSELGKPGCYIQNSPRKMECFYDPHDSGNITTPYDKGIRIRWIGFFERT